MDEHNQIKAAGSKRELVLIRPYTCVPCENVRVRANFTMDWIANAKHLYSTYSMHTPQHHPYTIHTKQIHASGRTRRGEQSWKQRQTRQPHSNECTNAWRNAQRQLRHIVKLCWPSAFVISFIDVRMSASCLAPNKKKKKSKEEKKIWVSQTSN